MYDNQRLLDVFTRLQIYVEGVKTFQHKQFERTLRELDRTLKDLLNGLRVKRMDELTLSALRGLVAEVRRRQSEIYSKYTEQALNDLKEFAAIDLLVSKVLFSTLQRPEGKDEKPVSEADATGDLLEAYERKRNGALLPFTFLTGSFDGNEKLWSRIINTPIPANGLFLIPFVQGFSTSASNSVENIIRKGYANASTVEEVIEEIRGTNSNNFRDGALHRINTQAGAMTATAIQAVSSMVHAAVMSVYHDKYLWSSVIDGRTTPICRSRNGTVYEFGNGPLPPAHVKCRSRIIPLVDEEGIDNKVPTWVEWYKRQPEAFSKSFIKHVKDKTSKEFSGVKAVSPKDFKKSVSLMLIR